ncbi:MULTISPECIES: hypothetical protein [Nitrosomonas]|uniref:Uncharacterized protein n=1 Tax=Nitrosomonas communis TaxID=44574 RepID=A0A0F7KCE5_9PROT|nr:MULTISPECIES: hypothetical protein [Nitrosomonas]AKH37276.1 hypothetical protein AAW31_04815 [Nitrosomonas communis]TYP84707.1 hypothetical protein BCL69_103817 [Nitrosomonas communis]UVS62484.1 hypothetical protein NX761_05010 [Nitrosomonas sp. PLL12]
MHLTCPCCQAEYPLLAAINNAALRNVLEHALSQTPVGKLLLIYVDQLFKPPQREISDTKLAKLLSELIIMVEAGKIEHKGRVFPAPQAYWKAALEQMIDQRDTLTLPLKSHSYLFTIIASAADKAAKKVETEQEMRTRIGHVQQEQEAAIRKGMPEAVRNQLQEIINKNNP